MIDFFSSSMTVVLIHQNLPGTSFTVVVVVVVGDRISVKWLSRLSLSVKSPEKSDSISYLPQVYFAVVLFC